LAGQPPAGGEPRSEATKRAAGQRERDCRAAKGEADERPSLSESPQNPSAILAGG